jgi:fatty acid amide hydrolase
MIPFARTNVPQLAMTFACNNYLWGRTLNPWNKERSVGGSSGGEAGLISSRCSPIGIGTDFGGSLRIPASFCGLYTLKSGKNRLSTCES